MVILANMTDFRGTVTFPLSGAEVMVSLLKAFADSAYPMYVCDEFDLNIEEEMVDALEMSKTCGPDDVYCMSIWGNSPNDIRNGSGKFFEQFDVKARGIASDLEGFWLEFDVNEYDSGSESLLSTVLKVEFVNGATRVVTSKSEALDLTADNLESVLGDEVADTYSEGGLSGLYDYVDDLAATDDLANSYPSLAKALEAANGSLDAVVKPLGLEVIGYFDYVLEEIDAAL